MIKKCLGCGLSLQIEDENKKGYTNDLKSTYCKRCFRLKNYGEKDFKEQIDNEKLLSKINKFKGLVFFYIDFLNLNKDTLTIFKSIKLPKILVISKTDTLRKDMKFKKITKWLEEVYKITNEIIFLSNKNSYNNFNIFKYLTKYQVDTAIIAGITNAGKSTYLNALLKKNGLEPSILVSKKPNTTLDFIKIKLDNYLIYDTPGFNYTLETKILEKELKPKYIPLFASSKLVIANKYNFYFSENTNLIIYTLDIPIKRITKNITEETYTYKVLANSDIVIPGIGFLNIKSATTIKSNIKDLEIRKNISDINLTK